MTREIKFRVWCVGDTEIINWQSVKGEFSTYYMFDDSQYFKWTQYTGLKDKNGKEIYMKEMLFYCGIVGKRFLCLKYINYYGPERSAKCVCIRQYL